MAAWLTLKADYSQLVDRYRKLREISRRLHNEVLPKYLSKRAFQTCGRKLGIMRGNTFVFDEMDHAGVLMDYCLYDHTEEGGSAVCRYMADAQLDAQSDEYAMVKAMSESFHTLVLVTEVLPDVGVRVVDLFAGREFLLIDMGLSRTAVKGIVIATRLFPFDEFVMTSGAPLSVDADTLRAIRDSVLPQFETEGQYILVDAQYKADLTASIIRLCLNSESSGQVEYEEVEAAPALLPIRREVHIGRNDPCPCGSGKKHKHCCGRST
jgi:hypothetical protein